MRVKRLGLVLVLLVFVLTACATGPPPTPRHAYAKYLSNWNDFTESYKIHYEAQTLEVQADWTEHINPVLLKVSTALNAWGENPSSYDKEQSFLVLKREVERLLIKYSAPTPEEVSR